MCLEFAHAADMVVKAVVRKAPIVEPDGWVGFYAGGNIGYSWGKVGTTTSVAPFTQTTPLNFSFSGGSSAQSTKPIGDIGGGQIGHNWRIASHWLAGIEADIQGSAERDTSRTNFSGSTPCKFSSSTTATCGIANTTDITARLSWFGTVRGRAGVESNGLWVYGTAGLAYGKVSVSGANKLDIASTIGPPTTTFFTPLGYSKIRSGWTVGGGIEGRMGTSRWTWKVEYLHIDLGSIGSGQFGSVPVVTVNTTRFTDEIVRLGLNYPIGAARLP